MIMRLKVIIKTPKKGYCQKFSSSKLVKSLKENTMTLGVGPAGTGKTYLAVAHAVKNTVKVN